MSKKRHSESESEDPIEIRTFSVNHFRAYTIDKHSHDWHQLAYASRGVLTVNTPTGSWVVPPRRAVFIPAGIEHEIRMTGPVSVRTLYLNSSISDFLPTDCCVVNVSPLLRELILHAVDIGMLDRTNPKQARLTRVIVDQLQTVPTMPLKLPMPNDSRAVQITEILRASPADHRSIEELSREVGAGKRTIERLFATETDMTFGKWRQQLRLLHALKLLAAGEPVTSVALEVGYDSTSAFIAAFKSVLGTTPKKYYAEIRLARVTET